jgi:hypothetical protein
MAFPIMAYSRLFVSTSRMAYEAVQIRRDSTVFTIYKRDNEHNLYNLLNLIICCNIKFDNTRSLAYIM